MILKYVKKLKEIFEWKKQQGSILVKLFLILEATLLVHVTKFGSYDAKDNCLWIMGKLIYAYFQDKSFGCNVHGPRQTNGSTWKKCHCSSVHGYT